MVKVSWILVRSHQPTNINKSQNCISSLRTTFYRMSILKMEDFLYMVYLNEWWYVSVLPHTTLRSKKACLIKIVSNFLKMSFKSVNTQYLSDIHSFGRLGQGVLG